MGFRENSFATVWQVEQKSDRWTKLRISISRKNKETNEYEQDFSGWVDCFGTAVAAKAAKLKERDRIKLKAVDVTNNYDREKQTTFWNPKVFDFEMADGPAVSGNSGGRGSAPRSAPPSPYEGLDEVDEDDSDLPF